MEKEMNSHREKQRRTLVEIDGQGKKDLQSKIDEIYKEIKSYSRSPKDTHAQLDRLISLKGQLDIEATRLYVPERDVIKEYDNDNIRVVFCKDCIIWQNKGGFFFVVKPQMRGLYKWLSDLFLMKEKYASLTESERKVYDHFYYGMALISQIPLFAPIDDMIFTDIVNYATGKVNELVSKGLSAPLQEETVEENAEAEIINNAFKIVDGDGQ